MKTLTISMVMGSMIALGPGILSAEESPPSDDQGRVDTALPVGPILMGSFGIVTVVAGAGFGWQAYQENEDYKKKVGDAYPLATQKLADDIKRHAITADILMFSGGALVLGGVLWWLLDDRRGKRKRGDQTALVWHPKVGPGHASLAIEF